MTLDSQLLALVFENTPQGICIIDTHGKIIAANPAFCQITGFRREEAIGRASMLPDTELNDQEITLGLFHSLRETGRWQRELLAKRKNGEIYPIDLTICALKDTGNQVSCQAAIFTDISQSKQNEQTISMLAYQDPLTGLPNRMLFNDRLQTAISHAHHNQEKAIILLVNLDRFKVINDTLGYMAGDELLKRTAERLRAEVREGDTVARIAGDEFAIIMPDIEQTDAILTFASKILSACQKPWDIDGTTFRLTASMGIAVYPDDGDTAESLMKSVDIALAQAKELGPNNYQMASAAFSEKARERLQLEADLRQALEQNQFILHFQPQINTQTSYMSGAEVLVRWQHPSRGLVPPGEFIPLAEETGLIIPLGEWILRTACTQMATWLRQGLPPLRLSVNLSAKQFAEKDLLSTIIRIIQDTGISPQLLDLEITESIVMSDISYTIATLNSLKELGIQISLDDFGTGYSSLTYLKRLPFDTLKIDQSFIRDLENPDDAAITEAIIGLANNLRLQVVAEGVETEAQAQFLRQRACHEMQGYLFSPPVPAKEFETFMLGHCEIPGK